MLYDSIPKFYTAVVARLILLERLNLGYVPASAKL
jgi:hypothetical protein